ncbi:MAG: HTH domain-containing protein [Chloroflexi bacterium]|nr:HTH domain-containing protein [Chloroflexota bacterium]
MKNMDQKQQSKNELESVLGKERDKLQQEIEQLRTEIEAMTRQRQYKEERLGHLQALLASEPPANNERATSGRRSSSRSTPTPQLMDMVENVLRERKGEPMHYRDLAEELVQRGAVIRGQDPAGALVSRMTQDDKRRAEGERRFVRPTSKGFYALREDYPNARNVGARRRKRD